ncbi:MAG: hypothetical protein V1907_01850 [Candidatus Kerfeldbacteria bacterium]
MKRYFLIAAPIIVAGIVTYVAMRFINGSNENISNVSVVVINANTTNATDASRNVNAKPSSRDQVLSLARLFSERYGTTLTDAPNANIDSVLPFASASLKETLNRLRSRPLINAGKSVSTTSIALAFKIVSLDDKDGTAETVVSLQRKEDAGSGAPIVFMQDMRLSFVFEDEEWKVSAALWSARTQ